MFECKKTYIIIIIYFFIIIFIRCKSRSSVFRIRSCAHTRKYYFRNLGENFWRKTTGHGKAEIYGFCLESLLAHCTDLREVSQLVVYILQRYWVPCKSRLLQILDGCCCNTKLYMATFFILVCYIHCCINTHMYEEKHMHLKPCNFTFFTLPS